MQEATGKDLTDDTSPLAPRTRTRSSSASHVYSFMHTSNPIVSSTRLSARNSAAALTAKQKLEHKQLQQQQQQQQAATKNIRLFQSSPSSSHILVSDTSSMVSGNGGGGSGSSKENKKKPSTNCKPTAATTTPTTTTTTNTNVPKSSTMATRLLDKINGKDDALVNICCDNKKNYTKSTSTPSGLRRKPLKPPVDVSIITQPSA